LLKKHMHLIV